MTTTRGRGAAVVVAAAAAIAAAAAGCLAEGGPGLGEHLVAGRGMTGVRVIESRVAGGGQLVLFLKTQQQVLSPEDPVAPETFDLLRELHVVPRAGGSEPRRLLGDVPSYVDPYQVSDPQGRLLVQHRPQPSGATTWELTRVDPHGDAPPLGMGRIRRLLQVPPAGWIAYQRLSGALLVRGDDDGEHTVAQQATLVGVVGDSLVFAEANELKVVTAPGDPPRTVALGVSTWTAFVRDGEPALVVNRQAPDGQRELAIIGLEADPAGAPRLLARGRFVERPFVAPDGDRVVVLDSLAPMPFVRLRVLRMSDLQLLQSVELALPPAEPGAGGGPPMPGGGVRVNVEFRPGTGEVWCFLNRLLTVLHPDGRTVAPGEQRLESGAAITQASSYGQTRRRRFVTEAPGASSSSFTADGRRWVFRGANGAILLGDAADPDGALGAPVVRLGRDSDEVEEVLELSPSGALAIVRDVQGGGREDLHLLDPGASEPRPLLGDVASFVAGAGRILALTRKIAGRFSGTGDLVLVDLATGAETILSHNVSEATLSPLACDRCDPLTSGVGLTYVVQARIPWRHDGLWVAALP